ncbi:hypothetical protein HNQ94_003578 [Salirhabdus euzebyi]|uniref:Uncharacterized protein n=1 Tax=Salirhabdus euzebyi TaxID=394506 RepID=A0A841Q9V9_9BACI|nr:hypothetical protein [Salirhabdus euzebyi]MBB6455083.1 hypothetical protein [Salirhabdus euzebyi]
MDFNISNAISNTRYEHVFIADLLVSITGVVCKETLGGDFVYSCLVLRHEEITNHTKLYMLMATLNGQNAYTSNSEYHLEEPVFEIVDEQTVLALCKSVQKEVILQAAIQFETAAVYTSFYFDSAKKIARRRALRNIEKNHGKKS